MTERQDRNGSETDETREGAECAHAERRLCRADEEALDALIEFGFELPAAIAARPSMETRLRAAHAAFMTLEAYPVDPPDESLTDATLARIAREESARSERMRIASTPVPSVSGGRWNDFIGLACAAILLISVGAPIMSWMQGRNAEALCGANLRTLGTGIASYLRDHSGLPIAAGIGPDVGKLADWSAYRNHKHLDPLVGGGYCEANCTACGNDGTGEGYAYQVPSTAALRAWTGGVRIPALADRNPVIDLSRRGQRVGTFTMNSPEHSGRGQNVLFSDGAVEFLRSPILVIPAGVDLPAHQENIWLPMDRSQLEDGLDAPGDWIGLDVFLLQ